MSATADFHFLDVSPLVDDDLELLLVERRPGDPWGPFVPMYEFVMCAGGRPMGKVELRIGFTEAILRYAGQIGYWVHPDARGHHYAARACRLLLPLARRHGMTELWITCNPDNTPSRRTCEHLGAELVEIIPLPPDSPQYLAGDREKCRYRVML